MLTHTAALLTTTRQPERMESREQPTGRMARKRVLLPTTRTPEPINKAVQFPPHTAGRALDRRTTPTRAPMLLVIRDPVRLHSGDSLTSPRATRLLIPS